MPQKYGIQINEKTLDLIEFLNDGVRPGTEEKEEDRTRERYFLFTIENAHEITTGKDAIQFEEDLQEKGYMKDPDLHLIFG